MLSAVESSVGVVLFCGGVVKTTEFMEGLSSAGRIGLPLVLAGLVALSLVACAPRKQVYIPPEWLVAAHPKSGSESFPTSDAKPSDEVRVESPPEEPILEPPPTFEERDIVVAPVTPSTPEPKKQEEPPEPQQVASMHLVDVAKVALAQGNADQAISQLEQAIQVDVYNGEAFFLLSKAWRRKNYGNKALEFAKKAELLLQDDSGKLREVYLYEADLYKDAGNTTQRDVYLRKAAELAERQ